MSNTNHAAPALDAGGLDDLDLDGMFNETGDMLFEGFDMELEGMGDIVDTEKNTMAPSPPKRRKGPNTKRTNPMADLPRTNVPVDDGPPKRRKTKRKSKAPAAYGDDDDEYFDDAISNQPKSKRRKAATGKSAPAATNKKSKKKDATAPAVVAAAGQFGGRQKRANGTTGTGTKVKRKLKKGEMPSDASLLASQGSPYLKPPKPEPTFGGLNKSKTMFYPFMESVPPQPNLKKKTLYPSLDKVFSTFQNTMLKSQDAILGPEDEVFSQGLTVDSPIFKLLCETFQSISEKERNAFTIEKQAALLRSIPYLRKFIHQYNREKVVTDVYAMLGLLTRQYNFLKVNLDNMHSWCQTEFTPADYKATYTPPKPKNLPTRWKTPFVKIKVVCSGFKEPKGSSLLALLPLSAISSTVSDSDGLGSSKGSKKKKSGSKSTSLTSLTALQIPSVPKSYAECPPQERRQRILERLSQLASDMQDIYRKQQLHKEFSTNKKQPFDAPKEDHLATNKMWEFLDAKGFYKVPVTGSLHMVTPEIDSKRNIFSSVPTIIRGSYEAKDTISSTSLFDRLQSLLVEETDDDDEEEEKENGVGNSEEEEDDDDSSDDEDESLGFLDEEEEDSDVTDPMQAKNLPVIDMSQLSLEERTFIQLSRAGLVKPSLYSNVEFVPSGSDEGTEENDLNTVIEKMTQDLSKVTATNNARVAYLESTMTKLGLPRAKQVAEEQAAIIAKCQNLLRRNKEKAKKSSKQKKDELNLPW